ncbi:hypothetical protein Q9L58_002305 [Maublancomyces gigas]|uniref:Uncharacterized protein n=1 Tax=Discina gigas TaxID=1032678 RepID=A0ABR3GRP3_9PEZI
MPRKLPWATTTTTISPTATAPPKKEPPPKRQRTSPSSSSAGRPARRDVPAPTKTSAPNNDPVLAKPEYMTPRDEHYIMVEDEFLTIAQIYTRSVHRAEYERLQHLAHAKNATRISEIQRPVSGVPRMSKETLMKHELAAKQQARESALEGLPSVARKWDEDSSEDEARKAVRSVWAKSSLGLLMCSPKKRERDLSARWTVKPGTRAAAGFVKSEVDTRRRRRLFTSTDSQELGREINIAERQTGSSTGTGKPAVKQAPRPAPPKHEPVVEQGAESASDTSSSDDDDLDAPVVRQASRSSSQVLPTARPSSIANPPHRSTTFPTIYPPSSTHQPLPKLSRHATAPLPSRSSQPAFSSSPPLPPPKKPPPDFDFDFGLIASKRSASSYRGRSMTARKQAEQQKSIISSPPAKGVGRGGGEVRQRPRLLDALFFVGE